MCEDEAELKFCLWGIGAVQVPGCIVHEEIAAIIGLQSTPVESRRTLDSIATFELTDRSLPYIIDGIVWLVLDREAPGE
jgi:hypothetical protein